MWLEAYLRNGKVIQSNVLEVLTDDGQYDPLAGLFNMLNLTAVF
jgi:hypothetical protein